MTTMPVLCAKRLRDSHIKSDGMPRETLAFLSKDNPAPAQSYAAWFTIHYFAHLIFMCIRGPQYFAQLSKNSSVESLEFRAQMESDSAALLAIEELLDYFLDGNEYVATIPPRGGWERFMITRKDIMSANISSFYQEMRCRLSGHGLFSHLFLRDPCDGYPREIPPTLLHGIFYDDFILLADHIPVLCDMVDCDKLFITVSQRDKLLDAQYF